MRAPHERRNRGARIGAAQSIDLYSNSISASAGDFDLDGYADLVSIHSGGTFALRSYDNKTSSFSANLTHTVKMNGTISATTLTYLTAGIFANNSTTFSAVVTDLSWPQHALKLDERHWHH
jgi:hypothetical protein